MERIKELRQKRPDGYTNSIPIGADAQYVDLQVQVRNQNNIQNEKNLQDIMGIYKKQSPIANIIEQHFYGTLDEWNALTTEQKKEYDIVDILETYTIHYDSNGGSGTMSDDTKLLGQPYTIKSSEFTPPNDFIDPQYTVDGGYRYKKYYTFTYKEWNTDEDGYEKIYHSGDVYTKDANLTLYAQWEKEEDTSKKVNEQYYVTINADDGIESVTIDGYDEPWVNKGDTIHLTIVTKPGYLILNGDETIEDIQHAETINITTICGLKFSSDEPFELSVETPGWNNTLEYTIDDGDTWITWDGSELNGTAIQPIYLRGIENTVIANNNRWTFTGKYCTGNIETLLDYQTVTNGQHPTMGDNCYRGMFFGCTSLITSPELPATTLVKMCYYDMFKGCISLVTVPELPAITLTNYCYFSMFNGCTSLTTAPNLPATTLALACYSGMFSGCTSLTTTPQLLATTLANECYRAMFQGCTSLTTASELPATTLAEVCYYAMFVGCTSLTTAPELPARELAAYCYSLMFSGCTSLVMIPELPATVLAENCYENMFAGCTSLNIVPVLPAVELEPNCYKNMFTGCSVLKLSESSTEIYLHQFRIPTIGDGTIATDALENMFSNTGGAFKGTPSINTIYYTDHQPGTTNNYIIYNANDETGNVIVDIKLQNTSTNIRGNNTFIRDDYDEEIEEDGYKHTDHHVYTFNSWNTEADGSGTQYDPNDTYDVNENLNLYAIWDDTTTITEEWYYLTVNKDNGVQTATSSQWVIKGNSVNVTATAKSNFVITNGTGSTGAINAATTVNVSSEPIALKFSSDSDFTLSAVNKGWNGTLQYSTNHGSSWTTWNGSELNGTATQPIYLRGTNNTVITGSTSTYRWTFTGKYCTGNIETLLDYQTVINGQHPTMGNYCYKAMFMECTSLTTAPELPATTLAHQCYTSIFRGCTSLTTAPELPAKELAYGCYYIMFYGCTSLTTAPKLPATTLADYCYNSMFQGCTTIKLSTTQTGIYQYKYSIPTSGTGTTASDALTDMFINTGGTFKGTPTINTTYYTDHQPV